MKKILFAFLIIQSSVFSQEITGEWSGEISIGGMSLGFGMRISELNGEFHSEMDIPDQKAMGIKLTSTKFENGRLTIESKEMGGLFFGNLSENMVSGTFTQSGIEMPFSMKRGRYEKKISLRPQEPQEPFNYEVREVFFENSTDKVTLAGTLTIPKGAGPFPAVVLVSGSGQQNRDSEIMGHKPFFVIADYLTNNGIAVLRYDDRGAGKSTGDHTISTSKNFALDALAAVTCLRKTKGIDKKWIGIIGHSEGGLIAPMVAVNKKSKVTFLILLAGPAVSGADILIEQQTLISRVNEESGESIVENRKMSEAIFQFIKVNEGSSSLNAKLTSFSKEYIIENELQLPKSFSAEQMAQLLANIYSTPWMQYFLNHDPEADLKRLKCPVLALNGAKDLQVPAQQNIQKFNQYAEESRNTSFETKVFPDLNHLFQHAETGAPSEYAKIEETFSPEVLKFMKVWIQNLKK